MPYINLIQEQRLAAQTNERKARSFFLAFVGCLALSGVAYGFLSVETLVVSRQAHNIETQNKKNEPIQKQIDDNGKLLAELTPRLKTLEDAQTTTDRWNHILNYLPVQTPQSSWLTGLRCMGSDPAKPIQISFLGVATSQSPVGEFILRLQNLKDLENVNLKYTNEKLISATKGIEFEIDSDLAGTAEKTVKTETTDGGDKK
jgi:Tfp pilus assembly protein PilN